MINIQHDVVSLLYSIKGRIETHLCKFEEMGGARSEEALPAAHEAMRKVYAQAQKALEMTRRAGEIMRCKPTTRQERVGVSLRSAWDQALTLLRPKYPTRQIDFIEKIPTGFPGLACREEDLVEILYYLLENSFQAMESKGSMIIRASIVYEGDTHTSASIAVSDTGLGISSEILSHLFKPYVTTKAPGVGNGLGLCLVQGLAHRNGGKVSIASFEGFGATVTLTLPLENGQGLRLLRV